MKKTKIIATIGPSSDDEETIRKMIEGGMNVARINCSHGDHGYISDIIRMIRNIDDNIAILLDTKGPEIRTGDVAAGDVTYEEGNHITITNDGRPTTEEGFSISYPHIDKIEHENILLIDDGNVEVKITGKDQGSLQAKVTGAGTITSCRSVSVHGHNVEMPFMSEKDREDILLGLREGVDFIAASFVRTKEDIEELRFLIESQETDTAIIAKIEHKQAVENIMDIVKVSDGIMIARGDLGVELSLERVPKVQNEIIRTCNELGRPVIVATQMLESMRENSMPTRAEVNDVAQAILQGADAIMLSGETASGKYPKKAVRMMAKIAGQYDKDVRNPLKDSWGNESMFQKNDITLFVTRGAYLAAKHLKTKAIITPTESGYTAQKVSRFRPRCTILAITRSKKTFRRLQLSWGVCPLLHEEEHSDVQHYIRTLVMHVYELGYVTEHDRIVMTAGYNLHQTGTTNLLEIYHVHDVIEMMRPR